MISKQLQQQQQQQQQQPKRTLGVVRRAQPLQPPPPSHSQLPPTVNPPNCPHVLVVDDSLVSQRVAKRYLERCGVATTTARDGIEAIQLVTVTHFDMVFMNLTMPHMDGLEATKHIRLLFPYDNDPTSSCESNTNNNGQVNRRSIPIVGMGEPSSG
jgi:CheY-like chemotaxis protein